MKTREIHFMDNTGECYNIKTYLTSLNNTAYSINLTYLVQISSRGKEYWYRKDNDNPHEVIAVDTSSVPEPLRLVTLLEK